MDAKHQIRSNPQNAQNRRSAKPQSTRLKTQETRALPDPEHRLPRASSKGRRVFLPNPPKNPANHAYPNLKSEICNLKSPSPAPVSHRRRDDAKTIDHPEPTMSNQLSISQIRRDGVNVPIYPTYLFLRALMSSWQESAIYNCRACSTNRPNYPCAYEALFCKTNRAPS